MLDLTDVRFVKRITIGSSNPTHMKTPAEIEADTALLNRCLNDTPKGTIVAIEKSFLMLQVAEHQAVLQWIVYHVGFPRKPVWLQD